MISKKDSLESLIYNQIQKGPVYIPDLIEQLKQLRVGTTKQGVYVVLRKLIKQEVVVVQKKEVSFSVRWLNEQKRFLSIAEKYYLSVEGQENFLSLKDGDKITYSFANPVRTDTFWWQALYAMSESSTTKNPVYLYNPHEWFLIARKESELESMQLISAKRQWLLTVPERTPLDRAMSKYFDGEITQYYTTDKKIFKNNNYYLNIVDDFIIEVWINKTIANQVEKLYSTSVELNDTVVEKLKELVAQKGRTKLVISKNYKKAEKIKKMLAKHFFIKN